MREGIVRQTVRADHGLIECEDALHVRLVHREIDRAGWS